MALTPSYASWLALVSPPDSASVALAPALFHAFIAVWMAAAACEALTLVTLDRFNVNVAVPVQRIEV